ncbi:MAG: hypothetical protein KME55_41290 [Nostoc indistinguendum CM1-VF10]|jgi:hypothetical protein|nr:hypothetical protein [Nostoc indistinguendum CM1-VF10]
MTKNKTNSQKEDQTTNQKSASQLIENQSANKYQYCSQPQTIERVFDPKVEGDRQRLIICGRVMSHIQNLNLHEFMFEILLATIARMEKPQLKCKCCGLIPLLQAHFS